MESTTLENFHLVKDSLPVIGVVTPWPHGIRKLSDADPHITNTKRVASCGKTLSESFGGTGEYTYRALTCGFWRACNFCLKKRIAHFTSCAKRTIINSKSVVILIFPPNSDKTIDLIRDTVTAKEYLRMPMADDRTAVMLRGDEKILSSNELLICTMRYWCGDVREVDKLDWENWVKTPWRRALTGQLGEIEKQEAIEDKDLVTGIINEVIHSDAPAEARLDAIEFAIRMTPETPTTPSDVIELINKRTDLYHEHILSLGFQCELIKCQHAVRTICSNYNKDNLLQVVWRSLTDGKKVDQRTLVNRYMDWLYGVGKALENAKNTANPVT